MMPDPGESNLGACPDGCCAITTIFFGKALRFYGALA
jgi:hypothetical protein